MVKWILTEAICKEGTRLEQRPLAGAIRDIHGNLARNIESARNQGNGMDPLLFAHEVIKYEQFILYPNRVFHKFSEVQECQHCQLRFSSAIENQLFQWSMWPWNIILMYPLISNSVIDIICYKQRRKLQMYGKTKLAVMPTLPTLCDCEKHECLLCVPCSCLSICL